MISHFNPSNIPLYEWDPDKGATLGNLQDFDRIPLKTYYLQKNYDGGNEDYWHLVNEAYDYTATSVPTNSISNLPFQLEENYPNPVKWKTTIPYKINRPGHVLIEVINPHGMVVDVLVNRHEAAGSHMVTWQSMKHPAGLYLYRMRFEGASQVGRILVYH
jgi:hypothetical protein